MYADTWYTNGSVSKPNTGFEGTTSGTWQPVWDAFLRFVEPLVSRVSHHYEVTEQSNHYEVTEQSKIVKQRRLLSYIWA